ncbi:MAG: hypothetical protein ACE5G5_11300 [Candidatus Methylomirabilales bacterium]
MAEEKVKNPFMEMYSTWEKMMAESFDSMMRNPAFVANMAKAFENSLISKEQIDRSVQDTLRAMSLPSTRDIAQIMDALGSLRVAVDELRGKVDSLLQKPPASPSS